MDRWHNRAGGREILDFLFALSRYEMVVYLLDVCVEKLARVFFLAICSTPLETAAKITRLSRRMNAS